MDPVSIISVISFAMQCSELTIRGAITAYRAAKVANNLETTIDSYKNDLNTCFFELETWARLWGFRENPPRFTEETLSRFWGKETHRDIRRLLGNISETAYLIEDRMIGKGTRFDLRKEFSSDDWTSFSGQGKVVYRTEDYFARELEQKYAKFLKNFFFALRRNEKLRDDLTYLRKSVIQLVQHSEKTYRLRFGDPKSITLEDLTKIEKLRMQIQSFTDFAQGLHSRSSALGLDWSLELRNPDDDGNAAEWRTLYNISIDFTLHSHAKGPRSTLPGRLPCRSIRISFDPEERCETQVDRVMMNVESLLEGTYQEDFTNSETEVVFQQGYCSRMSKPLRVLFWNDDLQTEHVSKAWELDRARLMLAFVNWMVMLLNTSWTDHVCCCQLRFQHFKNRPLQFVLSSPVAGADGCPNSHARYHKYLLLGMGIAEIVLRRPIRISSSEEHVTTNNAWNPTAYLEYSTSMRETKHGLRPVWRKVSMQKIIKDVKVASSFELAEAVEYCFQKSTSLLSEKSETWPQTVEELVTKVQVPVAGYMDELEKHRDAFSLMGWWRSIQTYWPVEACYDTTVNCEAKPRLLRPSTIDMAATPGTFPISVSSK